MYEGLKVDPIHVRLNVDLPQLYTGHDTEVILHTYQNNFRHKSLFDTRLI